MLQAVVYESWAAFIVSENLPVSSFKMCTEWITEVCLLSNSKPPDGPYFFHYGPFKVTWIHLLVVDGYHCPDPGLILRQLKMFGEKKLCWLTYRRSEGVVQKWESWTGLSWKSTKWENQNKNTRWENPVYEYWVCSINWKRVYNENVCRVVEIR